MKEELKKDVAALLQTGDRQALAELIVEYIDPTHLTGDIMNQIMETRSLNVGDLLIKKVRKGIRVYTLVPGSVHPASELTVTDRANYVLTGNHVRVTINDWELASGEVGSVEKIRGEMQSTLRDSHFNRVFNALSSIWTVGNTPNNYVNVGGPVTASALEDAIDQVNEFGGGVRAVLGARSVMTPISKFGAFWDDGGSTIAPVDSQLEEVMKNGRLGRYYGANLVMFDQIYDNPEDYNPLLPADKILVIGNSIGDFITYGSPIYEQWLNPEVTPSQWNLKLYQQIGMIVDNAQGLYVIGGLT